LHLLSEQLEGNFTAPYVDKVAGQVERFANMLRDTKLSDVKSTAENMAKNDPIVFYGGLFALGIGAARFLKSTAEQTSEAPRGEARGT
jgi:hypothetical protein